MCTGTKHERMSTEEGRKVSGTSRSGAILVLKVSHASERLTNNAEGHMESHNTWGLQWLHPRLTRAHSLHSQVARNEEAHSVKDTLESDSTRSLGSPGYYEGDRAKWEAMAGPVRRLRQ